MNIGRRMSVLDGVTIGSVLSCRGVSRLGSSLTVRSATRLGGETSVFESSNTFSCVCALQCLFGIVTEFIQPQSDWAICFSSRLHYIEQLSKSERHRATRLWHECMCSIKADNCSRVRLD
jgi:hypothetical protein